MPRWPRDQQDQHDAGPAHEHAPPLDPHRVGDGQADQHAPSRTGSSHLGSGRRASWPGSSRCRTMAMITLMVTGQRCSPGVLRRQAGTTLRTSPAALVPGQLGLVHQRIPDRVTDPAGVRRAEHPAAADRARRPGAGRCRARRGEPPAGGSGCIYPLLTRPVPCFGVRSPYIPHGPELPQRGEPWRSAVSEEHLELAARYAAGPSGTAPRGVRAAADGTDGGAAQYRACSGPPGRAGPARPAPAGGVRRPGLRAPRARRRARGTGPRPGPGRLPAHGARQRAAGQVGDRPRGMPGRLAKLLAGLADGSLSGAVALAAGLTGRRDRRRPDHRRRVWPGARRRPWPTC